MAAGYIQTSPGPFQTIPVCLNADWDFFVPGEAYFGSVCR